jgi:hypothetical protein
MKVLVVNTSSPSMRAEIWGWGGEDSDLYVPNKPIGMTPGPESHLGLRQLDNPSPRWNPKTVLEALADGWKLLGPPQLENLRKAYEDTEESWAWWLVRE